MPFTTEQTPLRPQTMRQKVFGTVFVFPIAAIGFALVLIAVALVSTFDASRTALRIALEKLR